MWVGKQGKPTITPKNEKGQGPSRHLYTSRFLPRAPHATDTADTNPNIGMEAGEVLLVNGGGDKPFKEPSMAIAIQAVQSLNYSLP